MLAPAVHDLLFIDVLELGIQPASERIGRLAGCRVLRGLKSKAAAVPDVIAAGGRPTTAGGSETGVEVTIGLVGILPLHRLVDVGVQLGDRLHIGLVPGGNESRA